MNRYRKNHRAALGAVWGVSLILVVAIMMIGVWLLHQPALHCVACAGVGVFACSGVVLGDEAFQQKVISGIEDVSKGQIEHKRSIDKCLEDTSRLDKEAKAATEELTKVKNTCNDQAQILRSLEKAQKAIALNARSSFRNPIDKALANEELRGFLNAFVRVISARKSGETPDPAFLKILEDANAKQKSLTGVDAGLGQATVPTVTFNEIYDTLLDYGDYVTLQNIRVGARTNVLPVANSRPQFYWIGSGTGGQGETSTITPGSFGGSSVTLAIQTLAVYLTVSRELLQDSTVDLAPYIMRQMTESIAFGLDTAAFIGTGSADQTNAGYFGIFNIGSVNSNCSVTTAQGNTTVAGTQLDDWVAVLTGVNAAVLKRSAKWWLHPQIIAKTVLVRDKNGRPIFQTWMERPDIKAIGSILGYPVISTAVAPNTDSAGQPIAAFGDPDGSVVGIREDLELATSSDINFPQNMMAYRALVRAGVKPKTLANSTTLVPLVALSLAAS
jgi:HK97 family phage major capsid protein